MKQKLLKLYFKFFGLLAKKYISKYKPLVIGVTGSIGKTSSRMIITEILQKHLENKIVYTSNKNFNGELGISLSILGIGDYKPTIFGVIKSIFNAIFISFFGLKKYDIVFLEYGIDHIGEMDFMLSIVKPDIAFVTKIDKVHCSQLNSKEIVATEKYKLLINTKSIVFLNIDDEFYLKYEKDIKREKYFFTTNSDLIDDKLDIKTYNYELKIGDNNILKSSFYIEFDNKKTFIKTNLIGKENMSYIGIGYFILYKVFQKYYNEVNLDLILQPSRFSILSGINNSILIDSSYNAAPSSMKVVLENVINMQKNLYKDYELILCLGEMRELGDYTEKEHQNLANFVCNKSQNIFIVGESMEKYFLPICKNAKYFKNSKILGEYLKDFLLKSNKKYLILFKGSQNTIFLEESVKQVLNDKNDIKNLCRQQDFWLKKKFEFFKKSL